MSYQSYQNFGYPRYGNYQPMQAPMMPPMSTMPSMSTMQRASSGPDWLFVPYIRDAASVSVQPGQKAWIMAQNEPVFAVRVADAAGVVSTKYYKFEETSPDAPAPAGDYITRAEFQQFVDSLNKPKGKKEVPAE